ncbi:MAG: hypothetical protein AMXMBFR82_08570 [Candidatus Hydrogenedentota bacterium]
MLNFRRFPTVILVLGALLAPGCKERIADNATTEIPEINVRIEGLSSSPDESQLAFAVIQESPYLGVISVDTATTRTFPAPGQLETFYGISWGPNGTSLVATIIEESSEAFRIQKLDLRKDEWSPIVVLEEDICQRAIVSLNAEQLVFRAAIEKDLYTVDLTTGATDKLTESGDTNRLGYAWAHDSASVYYSRNNSHGEPGIWRIDTATRSTSPVAEGITCPALALSRNGEYLAYQAEAPDGSSRLFVANADGSNPYEICEDSGPFFTWSLGQDRIASTSDGRLEIWDATKGEAVPVELAGNTRKSHPAWLEEGRKIAAVCNENEIWIYDFDTKTQQKVFEIEKE